VIGDRVAAPRVRILMAFLALSGVICGFVVTPSAQTTRKAASDAETLRHFQALVRLDTSSPPGNEARVVEYLKQVFDRDGIAYLVFVKDPARPNLVARITGNGRRRPILVMGHTDVVTVDSKKWTVAPFGAERSGGYIYGRGTVDDKDSVVAGLMLMLTLKRSGMALDRDVIFLAEAGEEGAPQVGAQFMVDEHFSAIDAEYCLAEGGGVSRERGMPTLATIGTTEKEPRPIELIAKGPSGHGSVPITGNALAHLSRAIDRIVTWTPPLRINETTASYFRKLATMVPPAEARRYRDTLNPDPKIALPAVATLAVDEPQHWSMLHTSLTPTIVSGGSRYNVIPSEARATLDVRLHPDEDQSTFLETVRTVIGDPAIEVHWARDRYRPAGSSRLDTEAFQAIEVQIKAHYNVPTLPTMGTGATDMAQVRSKGVQCYGIGPAVDVEDGGKGFGAHGDQERILETELYRFTRFLHDVVLSLAHAR
jgi:acetylornithine deacetylase/succinyl-diaminopimelate desuccinylase-like protein